MKDKLQFPYCSECGSKLLFVRREGAENWGRGIITSLPYSKFNSMTGERNLMDVYECPNRRTKGMFKEKINTRHNIEPVKCSSF